MLSLHDIVKQENTENAEAVLFIEIGNGYIKIKICNIM